MTSIFKSAPMFFKKWLYINGYLNKNKLISTKTEVYNPSGNGAYKKTKGFLNLLKNGVDNYSPKPTLRYYWVGGPISKLLNKSCNRLEKDLGFDIRMEYTIVCHFDALNEMFKKMKRMDFYDNTKIILLSDHGSSDKNWHEHSIYPLLMVKDFNSRGEISTSNKPMMNSDVVAIACADLDVCTEIEPDPREIVGNRKRIFNISVHGNIEDIEKNKLPFLYQIEVNGDVYNKEHWKNIK